MYEAISHVAMASVMVIADAIASTPGFRVRSHDDGVVVVTDRDADMVVTVGPGAAGTVDVWASADSAGARSVSVRAQVLADEVPERLRYLLSLAIPAPVG